VVRRCAPMCKEDRARRLRCAPLIAMMEATDFGNRDDRPGGDPSDRSVIWRVLFEAEMRSAPMIVTTVGREDASEVRLVDDDHVIETLSADRADQAFDVRILPRTRGAETTSTMPMPAIRRWKTSP
jgi:hypothetical protein